MLTFASLGTVISERWARANFDEKAFPSIAADTLAQQRIDQHLSILELVRWYLSEHALPYQDASTFGQPSLTVFRSRGFQIDVLFWLDSTTTIHQHGFSGAFQVLSGSSIHSQYVFDVRTRINSSFLLGDLRLQSLSQLKRGDIHPIVAGPAFVHALFHLDMPSVSLVVRTDYEREELPQYSYRPPSIALDPFTDDHVRQRRLRLLRSLAIIDPTEWKHRLIVAAQESDFESLFYILLSTSQTQAGWDSVPQLVELARARHGNLVDQLLPVLAEQRRQDVLTNSRATICDPDLRYFLALLLNVPHRSGILSLIGDSFSQDAEELLGNWLHRLVTEHGRRIHFLGIDLLCDSTEEKERVTGLLSLLLNCVAKGTSQAELLPRALAALPAPVRSLLGDSTVALCHHLSLPTCALKPLLL